MTETEVKLSWPAERGEARAAIEGAGLVESIARTFESNQLFDRSSGELRSGGCLLRLRDAGHTSILTYKGPASPGRYKSREEIECAVSDAGQCRLVLDRLGFVPGFRYEKFRTTFAMSGEAGLVTVDETPIGTFLELEGEESWIDAIAKRLGFDANDYIIASYAALYRDFRAANIGAPADMVFGDKLAKILSKNDLSTRQ